MEGVPHSSVMTPGCGGLPASILALLSGQCPSAAGAPPRRRRRAGSTAGPGEGSACRGRRAALASGELAGGARLWSFWAALSAKADGQRGTEPQRSPAGARRRGHHRPSGWGDAELRDWPESFPVASARLPQERPEVPAGRWGESGGHRGKERRKQRQQRAASRSSAAGRAGRTVGRAVGWAPNGTGGLARLQPVGVRVFYALSR